MGGVALIKCTGGSDLLLIVDPGDCSLMFFMICFDRSLELHVCSCHSMLRLLWVSILDLLASLLHIFGDHVLGVDCVTSLSWCWDSFLVFFLIFEGVAEV